MVVCSNGLRFRDESDFNQHSPCSLKVMEEVASMKCCSLLMPSYSSFSAARRSAIVRVRQMPSATFSRLELGCPGTSRQNCTYDGTLGSHGPTYVCSFEKHARSKPASSNNNGTHRPRCVRLRTVRTRNRGNFPSVPRHLRIRGCDMLRPFQQPKWKSWLR